MRQEKRRKAYHHVVCFFYIKNRAEHETAKHQTCKEVKNVKIQKVTDPAFRKYGKVLEGYNFSALLKEMKHTH